MSTRIDEYALDEFNKKADLIQRQVNDLLTGALDPDDVKMPGENSDAYISATSRALARSEAKEKKETDDRVQARALTKKWDAQLAERTLAEEKARWWKFARMQFGDDGTCGAPPTGDAPPDAAVISTLKPARGASLAIDYSWWDKWAVDPDDPVTKEEEARVAAEKEGAEMKAFEKANAGFCMSFKTDQIEREHADRLKAARAETLKVRGNDVFAKKEYAAALSAYHEALRLAPFHVAVLNNIAASHLALGDWEAAKEFASRTIFVEPMDSVAAVKARFRRAHAARESGMLEGARESCLLEEARDDLEIAAKADPANADVSRDLRTVRMELAERAKEAALRIVPAAAPGVAADGLPSKEAISDAVAIADLDALGTIQRTAARFERIAKIRAGEEVSTTAALRDELRALSRELRAVAARLTNDQMRVLARTSGLLALATTELRSTAAALLSAAAGSACPEAATAGGALARMAATASCAIFLEAACENSKNRVLVRGEKLSASALGATLDMFSLLEAPAASAWASAFGTDRAPSDASGGISEHLPLLHSSCMLLADAFARPSVEDPEGRALLVAHGLFRPTSPLAYRGTLAQRIAEYVELLGRYGPGLLPVGVLDTIATCGSILQQLCIVAPTPVAERGAKKAIADPSAKLHEAVSHAVCNIAGSEEGGGGIATVHPITAFLWGVTAMLGRALLDGEALLWSPTMSALTAAIANLAQKEQLRAALLVPMSISSAVGSPAATAAATAMPPQPALRSLIDLLRIPVPEPAPQEWDNIRGSILAALSNVCLNGSEAVDAIAGTGAVVVALRMLSRTLPSAVRGRTATLLGRLATSRAASDALSTDAAAIKQVVALLAKSCAPPPAGMPTWAATTMADSEGVFQDGLLRLLAGAGDGVADAIVDSDGLKAVVAALALALKSLQPPPKGGVALKTRVVGAGNACKVIITLASFDRTHASLLQTGACELLVDALKFPGPAADPATALVRKNAASAIARLMKTPDCSERLRSLRAMEVLLSLNREKAL